MTVTATSSTTPASAHLPPTRGKGKGKVSRPSSDASRFHMSGAAVDRSVTDYERWSDLKCVKHLATIRWGDSNRVTCPHCGTSAEHYFRTAGLRWKCRGCGSSFSVTSQTVFANRRIPLQKLLAALHIWASGAAGQPALELRRMLGFKGYNTAFMLVSKLREALVRGFNTGLVSGVVEMDGAHASGRRASEKRGRPQNYRSAEETKQAEAKVLEAAALTSSAKRMARMAEKAKAAAEGKHIDPEHGTVFPATRRIVFSIRRRSNQAGKGADQTRVGVAIVEEPNAVAALAEFYIAKPESVLATDTGTAFSKVGKEFQLHLQVNHGETLVGPDGEHNNNSESFSARMDRAEKGVYLNIEPKYLHDYGCEAGFKEDHRRMPPGKIADRALHYALNVGLSQDWRRFTQGHHRDYERLALGNQPAPASGPEKGRNPVSAANGRPPR